MLLNLSFAGILFGLLASFIWGTADFTGGVASRRGPVFGVVLFAELIGAVFMALLALIFSEPMARLSDLGWGAVAGMSGGIGVAALYASLARGQMGINAPIIAVVGAVLPVLFGIFTEGTPEPFQMIGFGLALIAVWLISRPTEIATNPPQGVGLAVIAGIGIGGFLILLDRIEGAGYFWPLALARLAAMPIVAVIAMMMRQPIKPGRAALGLAMLAGIFDAAGNLFFLLASQAGRLDVATVLSSLYPVSTVILARVILKERIVVMQAVGIAIALTAIIVIAGPQIPATLLKILLPQ